MTGARVGLGLSWPAAAPLAVALALFALVAPAEATIRYGAAQLSGNLESQQLVRLDRSPSETFEAFDLVQQRNTFRIQYEHDVVESGRFLDLFDVGLFESANLFLYYRLVYDSVYDIAPGPFFRSQEGGKAGSFDSVPGSARTDVALENVLREAFVDLDLAHAPVSFRVGRQQVVWGNTVNFRALDSVNALDLSWQAFLQYLPRPDVIIEPGVRIFWTDGRVVDDRDQVSKNAGRSELQLKLTYQY